jgi:hypothetical protein
MRFRTLALAAIVCLAYISLSRPATTSAQYIFLDADGDSSSTAADRLLGSGSTTADIWLVTNRGRHGSESGCSTVDGALTINSYSFILRAVSGSVTWDSFVNLMTDFTLTFGEGSNDTQFYTGFGSATALPPGKYLLGRLTVTPLSGAPSIEFAVSTNLSGTSLTCFGSQCSGLDQDNTLKLGTDWFASDGLGSADPGRPGIPTGPDDPGVQGPPPKMRFPARVQHLAGKRVIVRGAAAAANGGWVSLTAGGYPSGWILETEESDSGLVAKLSGSPAVSDTGRYDITWTAVDASGATSEYVSTLNLVADLGLGSSPTTGATIVGISTYGDYATYWSDANGINASLGRWDTPWPNGCEGHPTYEEPRQDQVLTLDIDVGSGGMIRFAYRYLTWDSINDHLDIEINTGYVVRWFCNRDAPCWGLYWESPVQTGAVRLDQWAGYQVSMNFDLWLNGYGTQTLANIYSVAIDACPIPPLTPLTEPDDIWLENHPQDETRLTTAMQTALNCFRTAVGSSKFHLSSAFRTPNYQRHLRELWDRHRDERLYTDPRCATLKAQVEAEWQYHCEHGGCIKAQPAALVPKHPLGIAFDATVTSLTPTRADALADSCGLVRKFKVRRPGHFYDPHHYELKQ